MLQGDLRIGQIYSNGKKRESIRKIVDFVTCSMDLQVERCVRYLVIKGLKPDVGMQFTMTRRSFARWAKFEKYPPQPRPLV